MGRIGEVQSFEDGAVKVDPGGGDLLTADHFAPVGDDSPPLAGDFAALEESAGAGAEQATGYSDDTEKKAAPGEKRVYARDAAGEVVAELWLKGDGSIEITSIKSGSEVTINGVTIDQDGNISTPGDVEIGPAGLSLLTHVHISGGSGSPSSGPQGP